MSLITDLLSKVKQREGSRDVPPVLKDAVIRARAERQTRRRLALLLAVVLLIVCGGFGVVYLIESLTAPSPVVRAPVPTAPAFEPASQPLIPAAPVKEQADAATSAKSPAAEARAAAAEMKKPVPALSHGKKAAAKKYVAENTQEAESSMGEIRRDKASGAETAGKAKAQKILSRDDKDFALYAARTYEAQGKYSQALSQYRDALALEPNNYAVLNNISSTLISLASYEESLKYAQRALSLKKDYVPSLVNMGIDYGYLGNAGEAENCFRKALSIDPGNRYGLLNLALLYERQGALEKADQNYARLAREGDVQGLMGSARIAERQKRTADAIHFYRMVESAPNVDSKVASAANERLMRLTR